MEQFTPGQVVEKTGFSLDTLRYYERIGLLDDIARNSGGQRVFTEDDVAWLRILRCLRDTGMPIQRMVRYAELARGGEETVAERLETATRARPGDRREDRPPARRTGPHPLEDRLLPAGDVPAPGIPRQPSVMADDQPAPAARGTGLQHGRPDALRPHDLQPHHRPALLGGESRRPDEPTVPGVDEPTVADHTARPNHSHLPATNPRRNHPTRPAATSTPPTTCARISQPTIAETTQPDPATPTSLDEVTVAEVAEPPGTADDELTVATGTDEPTTTGPTVGGWPFDQFDQRPR